METTMKFEAKKVVKTIKTFGVEDIKKIVRLYFDDEENGVELQIKEGFEELCEKESEFGERCTDPSDEIGEEKAYELYPSYRITLKDGTSIMAYVGYQEEPFDEFLSYKFVLC